MNKLRSVALLLVVGAYPSWALPPTQLKVGTYLGGIRATAVAVTATGDYVVAGGDDNCPGGAVVARVREDGGQIIWATCVGDQTSSLSALALDGAQNVVVVGTVSYGTYPGCDEGAGFAGDQAFIARVSAAGEYLNARCTTRGFDAVDVVVDGAGQPVVYTQWPVSLEKFAADLGTSLWDTIVNPDLDASHNGRGAGLAIDHDGNLGVVGSAWTSGFDLPTLFPPGCSATPPVIEGGVGSDVGWTAKLDASGVVVWRTYVPYLGWHESDVHIHAIDVAFDGSGNLVVVGQTDGSVVNLVGLGPAVECNWERTFGDGVFALVPTAVSLDASGRIVVAGTGRIPIVQGFRDTPVSYPEGWVMKRTQDGSSILWSTYTGGVVPSQLQVDMRSGQSVYVGDGTISGLPTTPGAFSSSPTGTADGYLAKLAGTTACIALEGPVGPTLSLRGENEGGCGTTSALVSEAMDLVRGNLDELGPDGLGTLTALACGVSTVEVEDQDLPTAATGFFYVSRYAVGGKFTDQAGSGLVGRRVARPDPCP